jgi:hypothetical protein
VREITKKHEEDLLIVHKVNPTDGRPHGLEMAALPFDVARLAAQLRAANNPAERTSLLAAIQGRFGNAFAERIVDAARSAANPPGGDAGGGPRGQQT